MIRRDSVVRSSKMLGLAAVLLAGLAVGRPAQAITGHYVADFEHPFVGLAVFYYADGQFSHRCSGSLLTPTVFLTAGHCVEGVVSARIYFQQDAGAHYDPATELDPVSGYPEYCAPGTLGVVCATSHELHNYGYPAPFPNDHDAGLVILDQRIALAEYGQLADAGTLDGYATKRGQNTVTFTPSGYGLNYTNPAITVSYRSRMMAEAQLVNLTNALTDGYNVATTNNPGIGGGTCFGDSGGPVFLGGPSSNVIVGLTSFGMSSNTCAGVDYSYRTDQADLIAWIVATVPAKEARAIGLVAP